MNRKDLGFLNTMFKHNILEQYSILIINQTTDNTKLKSNLDNITIINTTETGLSKSRNLAIKNATKPICLIADDDVIYTQNFGQTIINAYNQKPVADFISFKTIVNQNGKGFRTYTKTFCALKKTQLKRILSIEMSFKLNSVKKHNVTFNEWFGLGAKFPNMSNQFFVNDLYNAGLSFYEQPLAIVMHEALSSSDEVATERILYTRGAIFYKKYGIIAYFYIAKYAFFMLRKKYSSLQTLPEKLSIMQRGITDYKTILKQGLDTR